MLILAGARKSPLSQVQFHEIRAALAVHHPAVDLQPHFIDTSGDIDQKTSLRALGKTDFFTKEIDDLLLQGHCRVGIHSAKDLPVPIAAGLTIVALTRGLDPSDSLVLREGASLHSLPEGARIATSSQRREEAVNALRKGFRFVDLRGTIGQRLAKLDSGEADGVVVAEAALIRLGLTHLNRIVIPGETVPFQGQLAVVANAGDGKMAEIFRCLDSR